MALSYLWFIHFFCDKNAIFQRMYMGICIDHKVNSNPHKDLYAFTRSDLTLSTCCGWPKLWSIITQNDLSADITLMHGTIDIYMYLYICICIYIFIHIQTHICINIYIYTYIYVAIWNFDGIRYGDTISRIFCDKR